MSPAMQSMWEVSHRWPAICCESRVLVALELNPLSWSIRPC